MINSHCVELYMRSSICFPEKLRHFYFFFFGFTSHYKELVQNKQLLVFNTNHVLFFNNLLFKEVITIKVKALTLNWKLKKVP